MLFTTFSSFLFLRISLSQSRSYWCCFFKQSKFIISRPATVLHHISKATLVFLHANIACHELIFTRLQSCPFDWNNLLQQCICSLFYKLTYLVWRRYFCSPFQRWTYFDASKTLFFVSGQTFFGNIFRLSRDIFWLLLFHFFSELWRFFSLKTI